MSPDPALSPEALIVLDAISALDAKLAETQRTVEENTKHRIRLAVQTVVAVIVISALTLVGGAVGYAQYDHVSRCHARAQVVTTIKEVLAQDHKALPAGLRKGFPDSPDLDKTIQVIEDSYAVSEHRIDQLLPDPDCGGFLP